MTEPGDAVVLGGAPGAVLAGHVAGGGGPAQVAVLRTGGLALFGGWAGSPAGWWSSPALADAGPPLQDAAGCATAAGVHHGVNRRGLFVACAAAGPMARAGLAGAVLARAGGVEQALALISAAAPGLDGPGRIWLADPGAAARVDAGPDGVHVDGEPLPESAGADLGDVRAGLRTRAPDAAISAIAARLDPEGPTLLVCLGPPGSGVFVRQWTGLPPPPPLTAADGPPLLGSLAAALAAADAAPDLAAVEAVALAEGDDAERLARIMDAAGDDHGAEVRRVLAQSYAAGLAVEALEGRLAASGAGGGPTL
ncbi:MAG TPA: hypothetical protein VF112_05430 [Candidatus Dormibacteraeota bacterium]